MDRFIRNVVATADHGKAQRGSDKTINISFDEWNIWYNSRFENLDKIQGVDNWPEAPRLLEVGYTVADGVVFGSLLGLPEATGLTVSARALFDSDLAAANTHEKPDRVGLRDLRVERDGTTLRVTLPAVSGSEILLQPIRETQYAV